MVRLLQSRTMSRHVLLQQKPTWGESVGTPYIVSVCMYVCMYECTITYYVCAMDQHWLAQNRFNRSSNQQSPSPSPSTSSASAGIDKFCNKLAYMASSSSSPVWTPVFTPVQAPTMMMPPSVPEAEKEGEASPLLFHA